MSKEKEREKFAKKLLKFTRDLYLGKCVRIKYINDCPEPTDIGIRVDDIVLGNNNEFSRQPSVLFMSKEVILYDRNFYQISPINRISWSIEIPDAGDEGALEFTSMEIMSESDFNNDLKDNVAYLKDYLNIARQTYLGKSLKIDLGNGDVKYGRLCNIVLDDRCSELVFIWDEIILVTSNSVWFDKDPKGVKGNDIYCKIIKYQTPLTTIEYDNIKIIPDTDYDKLKEKYTSLMVEKYANQKYITTDYLEDTKFDLDGNVVMGRLRIS